ncbi:anaerobic ribonucleoside-triphosphate reductase activating protein [Infirmifilum lucidum]|uniref:Anaerobic ribonucleoside-triphosphate reductase activating protein n=1 Tax=Infirmifilum lucidum TaxID=2776706 RepID=A0A7L9FHY5_9CREN|nr:anaerobic ribonucleoside-triphosphate reductase activating protein [Infirmifilum lucidum]QOJ79438.1 anaerobic ribonucleoside-triphosphate reductase activating protein [Infirmifilum lucidum]
MDTVWIGGWKENSLVDVLENVSFTVWFSFCNFRCPWCANSRLARGLEKRAVAFDDIIEEVKKAAPFADYFHVTGGEPTLQYRVLTRLLSRVREETGLKLSFDTNASIPEAIRYITSGVDVDHIAVDIKAPLSKPELYARVVGLQERFGRSIVERVKEGIKASTDVRDFLELRTLMVPGLLGVEDIVQIAREIRGMDLGSAPRIVYVVQQFIPYEGVPSEYRKTPKTPREQVIMAARLAAEELKGFSEVYYRTIEDGSRRI